MVSKRAVLLLLALPLVFCVSAANAQADFKFLGNPVEVPDQFSPRYHIRYNSQGFDQPKPNWKKKLSKLQKKKVPDYAINEIQQFPGSPDAIGEWIDEAFEDTQKEFTECGGPLAGRASRVSTRGLYVVIMPSAFFEPYYKVNVAGVYYPDKREIRVLNIYYTWSGENKGWLRHARDLLKWEMGNFIGTESGVMAEPRAQGWPCNAPALK
ncbi:MAG: hypothetical protein WBV94_24320 [Blastocatellia bacterium]